MAAIGREFFKGLWKEIPPFRLVLGLCPALGCTTKAATGLGMGLAMTFVLFFSNVLISSLRGVIPNKVRIASFIVVVATFVIIVERFMAAYFYDLFMILGYFVPLIVVNCILLGRAEAFASKRPVIDSAADGLGFGLGYTMSLTALGGLREIFGLGTIFGVGIMGESFQPFEFLQKAPGAFVCLGLMLGVMNIVGRFQERTAARKGATT